ncbi:MAG: prephenate dehydrogenase [Treponema sp.]|nr:prephenate dehydrogenase [Treponema sp.]
MKELEHFTYGIVGMGLMGGSLAKAIRANVLSKEGATGKIYACDINRASLDMCLEQHIADKAFTIDQVGEMLGQCDFVYICLYPHATAEFLIAHKKDFKSGAIVSDISGVKALIFDHIEELKDCQFDFIPGHPMAGSEREGYAASNGSVFANHNYILMPLENTDSQDLELFKSLITAMGFTRIVETDANVHDHKIAFTSQLCHVIASALVDSAEDTEVTAFGGGSFEDLTRIALINAPLWTELFLANKKELLGHIEKFQQSLEVLKNGIKNDDSGAIKSYLENVRVKRTAMSRIDTKKFS